MIKPLADRVLAYVLPVKTPGLVVGFGGEPVDTNNTGVYLMVVAVGSGTYSVEEGDVVVMAKRVLLNLSRPHNIGGVDHFLFHEADIDAIESKQ